LNLFLVASNQAAILDFIFVQYLACMWRKWKGRKREKEKEKEKDEREVAKKRIA